VSAGVIYTEYNIRRPMLKYALKASTREMSKLFEIMMVSVFQYGCENWTLLKQHERRTERAEMEVSCQLQDIQYITTKQMEK
jgi:hypothetical protein